MSLLAVRRTAVALAVLTFFLMVLGSWVKATGSGLACPDWPTCYGDWLPPFPSADNGGTWQGSPVPYSEAQVLYEWAHRLVAVVVGFVALGLAALTYVERRQLHPMLWRMSAVSLGLIIVQAGLGGVTVRMGNAAAATTIHLANALLTFTAILTVVAYAVLKPFPDEAPEPQRFPGEGAEAQHG